MHKGRVYFSLDGDNFDPDNVTELVGIEPTFVNRKGSKVPEKIPRTNSWEFSTEYVEGDFIDIYELSSRIVNVLSPKKALINKAIELFQARPRFQVVLTISVDEEHPMPAFGFDKETAKFIGDVGAFVDIDTYRE